MVIQGKKVINIFRFLDFSNTKCSSLSFGPLSFLAEGLKNPLPLPSKVILRIKVAGANYLQFSVSCVRNSCVWVCCHADEVGDDLYGVDKTLREDQLNDSQGGLPRRHLRVNEGVQDGFQVHLDHCGRHAG